MDANARLWIDLHSDETPEVDAWLDKLAVTGLSRRLCLEARDRPGFYPLEGEIVLVLPILADAESPGAIDFLTCLPGEPATDPNGADLSKENRHSARATPSLRNDHNGSVFLTLIVAPHTRLQSPDTT